MNEWQKQYTDGVRVKWPEKEGPMYIYLSKNHEYNDQESQIS